MNKSDLLHAWTRILAGRAPSLSIEITKECPLRCPGCYAFDAAHLGTSTQLRQLSDFKGDELVSKVLETSMSTNLFTCRSLGVTRWSGTANSQFSYRS